jgi:hypothetical protein
MASGFFASPALDKSVQIYDVGEHAGVLYFSLEYLAGGSLARKLRGQPLSGRSGARQHPALRCASRLRDLSGDY